MIRKGRQFQHRSATSGRRVRVGFSIVELLVVMTVIAILVSIALPAVKAISRDNASVQSTQQIRALISQARAIAIARHCQAGVVFFEETAANSRPVHGNQVAAQLIVEDFDQGKKYNPLPENTVFIEYAAQRHYLPVGIQVAALNDDIDRGVMTGDEASGSLGRTRVILFDAQGRLRTRTGLARPDLSGAAGSPARARDDWGFITKRGTDAHVAVSSPGLFVFDIEAYKAQNIPADHSGDLKRNAWIKDHASVILVNANTGGFIEND